MQATVKEQHSSLKAWPHGGPDRWLWPCRGLGTGTERAERKKKEEEGVEAAGVQAAVRQGLPAAEGRVLHCNTERHSEGR